MNAVIHVPVVFLLHCMSTNAERLLLQNSCCSEEAQQHKARWTLARGAASEDLRVLSSFHCPKDLAVCGVACFCMPIKANEKWPLRQTTHMKPKKVASS